MEVKVEEYSEARSHGQMGTMNYWASFEIAIKGSLPVHVSASPWLTKVCVKADLHMKGKGHIRQYIGWFTSKGGYVGGRKSGRKADAKRFGAE